MRLKEIEDLRKPLPNIRFNWLAQFPRRTYAHFCVILPFIRLVIHLKCVTAARCRLSQDTNLGGYGAFVNLSRRVFIVARKCMNLVDRFRVLSPDDRIALPVIGRSRSNSRTHPTSMEKKDGE